MEELGEFFSSFRLGTPVYFWIAIAVALIVIFFPFLKKSRLAIDLKYWEEKIKFRSKRVWRLSVPVILITIMLAGAIAAPQVKVTSSTDIYGIPVLLAMDVSGSMGGATSKTLEAYYNMVSNRGDINFGLMLFSSESYIIRYFVNKDELLEDTLENSDEIAEIAGGTYIANALEKAYSFITENTDSEEKAIILLSDLDVKDEDEWADIVEEMNSITGEGIRLYIVFTGKEDQFDIEGQTIEDVSGIFGVELVALDDTEGIDRICAEISSMELSLIREEEDYTKESVIHYFVIPALLIMGISLILTETRFRKIP
jgi:Ca-activated chloride channel family protein